MQRRLLSHGPRSPLFRSLAHVQSPLLLLVLLLTGSLTAVPAQSQSFTASTPWRWSNPTPSGHALYDLASTNGFQIAVGELGSILTSTDTLQWIPRTAPTAQALRSVAFFKDVILISGESGTLLRWDSNGSLQKASLDLPTSAWLEALATSPSLALAVGDAGTAYTSSDGLSWRATTSPGTAWLRSASYGNGLFVVVGENGFIATSPDTKSWTRRSSPSTRSLNRVTWSGTRFFAVGDAGTVLSSANGQSWSSLTSGASQALYAVAASNSDLVVAGVSEVRYARVAAGNSFVWSNYINSSPVAANGLAPAWTYLSACTTDSGFLLGGQSGMLASSSRSGIFITSLAWSTPFEPIRNWLWDLGRFGNQYFAVGDHSTILSSSDGISWELELASSALTNAVLLGIGGGPEQVLAVGNSGALMLSTNTVFSVLSTNLVNGTTVLTTNRSSALGIYWDSIPSPTPNVDLQGVAFDGTRFVVTGGNGTLLTSTNALIWRSVPSGTTNFLSSVTPSALGWFAVGDKGTILRSTDTLSWSPVPSPTTNWIYRVRALNQQLFAVGEAGTLLNSKDGSRWVAVPSSTTQWLTDIAFLGSSYLAIGARGTWIASTDGSLWSSQPLFTSKSLYSLASNGSQLLAVGVDGALLRNQWLPKLDPIYVQYTYAQTSSTLRTHSFQVAGSQDQVFSIDSSTNLVDWTLGPTFEVSDPADVISHSETTDSSVPQTFFRARPR